MMTPFDGKCPLCDGTPANIGNDREGAIVSCIQCGDFLVDQFLVLTNSLRSADGKRLSAATRWSWSVFGERLEITKENIESLQRLAPSAFDVDAKVDRLLRYIAHRSISPGDSIQLHFPGDSPIVCAWTEAEYDYIFGCLSQAGYAIITTSTERKTWKSAKLTPDGWRVIRARPNIDSS